MNFIVNIDLNIQAIWLMDEYLKIFRILIWFNPKILPVRDEIITIKEIKIVMFKLYINKIIGANFCQVNINIQLIQVRPSITSGNHEWNGAAPIFIRNLEFIIIIINLFKFSGKNSFIFILIINENIRIAEANVWAIKYFIIASADKVSLFFFKRGIIDSKLISSPIHILIQE